MTPACRTCGAEEVIDLGPCPPPGHSSRVLMKFAGCASFDPGRLFKCNSCGLTMRHPVDRDCLNLLYESIDNVWKYDFEKNTAWVEARRFLLSKYSGTSPRILDVGAARGGFLDALPNDWQRFAVEPSKKAQETLRELGIKIVGGTLDDLQTLTRGSYDVVTMFDVLEHLEDPAIAIKYASDVLVRGGFVIVSTADTGAWPMRWLGRRHWYYETPLHISFCNQQYFEQAAKTSDLSINLSLRLPHQREKVSTRFAQYAQALVFGARWKGRLGQVVNRVAARFAPFGKMRNEGFLPYFQSLEDHLFVALRNR